MSEPNDRDRNGEGTAPGGAALRDAGSPYLRQHADDPVRWWAWGPEPFAEARARDLPVLVSIGYAACHWCHVLQHETFQDPEVAAWLNERFVAVKVDREEHPDVDATYMAALQALRGQGGWPLTVVTDAGGRPFFAGTYFPPDERPGMPSFRRALGAVSDAWRERRALVLEDAARLHAHLVAGMEAPEGSRWDPEPAQGAEGPADAASEELAAVVPDALAACRARVDTEHGGLRGAPKFPPHGLLRWWSLVHEPEARDWRDRTLGEIVHGGIADPLVGGIARYAVDAAWRVPHFEKMLSDNVQLLPRFAEAWRDGNAPELREAARSTFAWLEAELRLPDGLYATALDADARDADGRLVEGAFYAWTASAFDAVVRDRIGVGAVPFARDAFGVRDVGPFEGANVLRRALGPADLAARHDLTERAAAERLERVREALTEARASRPRPARDDKALLGLNGLAVAGLARAGRLLNEPAMTERARELAGVALRAFRTPDGRWMRRRYRDRLGVPARLEDHAHLALGLLEAHRADGDPAWAIAAKEQAERIHDGFEDREDGGFLSAPDAPDDPLPLRPRSLLDAAMPSDTAAAAEAVHAVARLLGDAERARRARAAVRPLVRLARRHPEAAAGALCVQTLASGPDRELVITGPDEAGGSELQRIAAERRLDGWTFVRLPNPADPDLPDGPWRRVAHGADRDGTVAGRAAAWVCRAYRCDLPVTDPEALARALDAAGDP